MPRWLTGKQARATLKSAAALFKRHQQWLADHRRVLWRLAGIILGTNLLIFLLAGGASWLWGIARLSSLSPHRPPTSRRCWTDLRGANLHKAHLEGAFLSEAHLEGAFLGAAHLDGADLTEAHLDGALLGAAHLDSANLGGRVYDGASWPRRISPAPTFDNKRLSAVLAMVKARQAEYEPKRQRGHVARQRPPNNLDAPGLPSKGRASRFVHLTASG